MTSQTYVRLQKVSGFLKWMRGWMRSPPPPSQITFLGWLVLTSGLRKVSPTQPHATDTEELHLTYVQRTIYYPMKGKALQENANQFLIAGTNSIFFETHGFCGFFLS
jgi:hypothetical protein